MASRMRKPVPVGPRLLMAGDTGDLPAIRARLCECEPGAAGLVVIEAVNALQIAHLEAPAGVGVHWVFRERARDTVAARGEVLVAAVDAWLDEWMRGDGGVAIEVWIGARTSSIVNAYARELERELAAAS